MSRVFLRKVGILWVWGDFCVICIKEGENFIGRIRQFRQKEGVWRGKRKRKMMKKCENEIKNKK